ncbi:hypothetical protein HD806DRAFT_543729 [Xylariaceae sp. AK1471]|nr:hypothetical protein HD806DRAFT_543729 [Xylariaceae sp. AK1471]
MESNYYNWSKTVFRVRRLPQTLESFEDVAKLVNQSVFDIPDGSIRVYSLATTLDSFEKPPTKVATIMFATIPSILRTKSDGDEWFIPARGHGVTTEGLILDTHFMGMTPLNDVNAVSHLYDCIAISGLASHPFGSWQPRASDKAFNWVRDELPIRMKGARSILYGYSSQLHQSQSFQTIADLARGLICHLQASSCNSTSARPIAFICHSLGGLVLQDALVQLARNPNEEYRRLLSLVRGALCFGVPNLGMEQSHLRTIVRNNPNAALVDDIARNSNYLRSLNEEFLKVLLDKGLIYFWAYETVASPTVIATATGGVDRSGPPARLVSPESATCRFNETKESFTFPVEATHSDMVKFTRGSPLYSIIFWKLGYIFGIRK